MVLGDKLTRRPRTWKNPVRPRSAMVGRPTVLVSGFESDEIRTGSCVGPVGGEPPKRVHQEKGKNSPGLIQTRAVD